MNIDIRNDFFERLHCLAWECARTEKDWTFSRIFAQIIVQIYSHRQIMLIKGRQKWINLLVLYSLLCKLSTWSQLCYLHFTRCGGAARRLLNTTKSWAEKIAARPLFTIFYWSFIFLEYKLKEDHVEKELVISFKVWFNINRKKTKWP